MKRANTQLAHLIERLPAEVQNAIKQLNLIDDETVVPTHSSEFAHHFFHHLPSISTFTEDFHQLPSRLNDKESTVLSRSRSFGSFFCEEKSQLAPARLERSVSL